MLVIFYFIQSYKDSFKKIIAQELEKDIYWKTDFDVWGHRLYAFVNDNKNVELNFEYMKTNIYLYFQKRLFNNN